MKRFNYKKIFNTFFNEKNTKKTLFILIPLLIFGVAIAITLSIDLYGTEEVRSVEIDSNDWSEREPGSWHIDKSAEWTGLTTAKVTFDFDSVMKPSEKKYDVIFVLDVSGSMADKEKLKRVKEDSIELVNYLFSWGENRVAFITFTDTAEIISPFTQNKDELIGLIQGLKEAGSTNYKAGLELVDTVMKDYEEETGRKLVTLFLTDGFPNIDTPNEVAEYEYLKQKYPYMSINGVQYEMGTDIVEEIKRISDEQFYADVDNLENVLFDASIYPVQYEKLEIVDYVKLDRFYVKSVDDIKVSFGTVELDEPTQKITWNLDGFKTGRDAHMEITLHLTDKFTEDGHPKEGMYPTNEGEEITHKLPEEPEVETPSKKTPILKAPYLVIYDVNAPSECNIKDKINEKHYAFETVTKRTDAPDVQCSGYQFKGWELDEKESINPEDGGYDVKHLNDDMFVMPQHDVTLRGIWTKVDISKSMDGTVYEKLTLYQQIANDTNIRATTLNGQKIYYYNSSNANIIRDNNVIFADKCWQIIRTTETEGVKLIYNGVPVSGTCESTGADTTIGNSVFNSSALASQVGYMYNANYEYEVGEQKNWNELKYENFGAYVTLSDSYEEKSDGTYTLTNPIQITKSAWGSGEYTNYISGNNHYMCQDFVSESCSSIIYTSFINTAQIVYYKGFRYSNDVTYNSVNKTYKLNNPITAFLDDTKSATLVNTHHYTCFSKDTSCSTVYYVTEKKNPNTSKGPYYVALSNGDKISNLLGSILYNEDVNREDSVVKKKVDTWYENNFKDTIYEEFIEDTIYCNNRATTNDSGVFNLNKALGTGIYFPGSANSSSLTCEKRDSFTVGQANGNGKLTYPIGLITAAEASLSARAIASGIEYWSMSPYSITPLLVPSNAIVTATGARNIKSVTTSIGIRPVISIKTDDFDFTGTGSKLDPYVIIIGDNE